MFYDLAKLVFDYSKKNKFADVNFVNKAINIIVDYYAKWSLILDMN